jgi:site-specific DNA-methyltransferase (adenine-specific)
VPTTRRSPGLVRDAIIEAFKSSKKELSVSEIRDAVNVRLAEDIPASSVRSYLRLNTPGRFTRTGRGTYRYTGR